MWMGFRFSFIDLNNRHFLALTYLPLSGSSKTGFRTILAIPPPPVLLFLRQLTNMLTMKPGFASIHFNSYFKAVTGMPQNPCSTHVSTNQVLCVTKLSCVVLQKQETCMKSLKQSAQRTETFL